MADRGIEDQGERRREGEERGREGVAREEFTCVRVWCVKRERAEEEREGCEEERERKID